MESKFPDTVTFGEVSITRIEHVVEQGRALPGVLFPDSKPETWQQNESWLAPDFYDSASGTFPNVLFSWLIRSEGRTILLDTAAGDHKERPYAPLYAHHDTKYISNLADAGVHPNDVDLVINTHLHLDHIGWNTRLEGRTWVPTFPNARYLMSKADFEFWDPRINPRLAGDGNQNAYEDSVIPVTDAGLVDTWEDSYVIDKYLKLDPAPGHTPGNSVLRLEADGALALFTGDIFHSPTQLIEPDVNTCFCEDQALARKTRRNLLSEAAERRMFLFPAHFAGHTSCRVSHKDEGFEITDWAAFDRITPPGAGNSH